MFDFTTLLEVLAGWGLFCGIFGYYVGQRGLQGVRIDMNNAKNDIEKLKGKISDGTTTVTTPTDSTVTVSSPSK